VLSPALFKRRTSFGGSLSACRFTGNLSAPQQFCRQTGPACKAPSSPPGWLAPADIGKNPGPRGFCFSASDQQISELKTSDSSHIRHHDLSLAQVILGFGGTP
jgi:hypothetical protein